MESKLYLVRVNLQGDNCSRQNLYQYCMMRKKDLDLFMNRKVHFEGGCCSQGGCLKCALDGITYSYDKHYEITDNRGYELAKFVCHDQHVDMDSILEGIDDQEYVRYMSTV